MNQPYLIQRGVFKEKINISTITGIDSIIEFDYMGSSEFEFGAMSKSLKRIVKNYNGAIFYETFSIKNKKFVVLRPFGTQVDTTVIYDFMTRKAENEYSIKTKECVCIDKYLQGKYVTQLKHGCVNKTEKVLNYGYCDFWWDIDYDWIMFPFENQKIVDIALKKLVERRFFD